MVSDQLKSRQHPFGTKRAISRFAADESGMVTIFACFMIFIMLMVGGIGVDLMRNEMERTRLQGVADRAVLAAADLDQTLDPEAVVRDYFNKSGMADYVSSVTIDSGLNYRTVTVDATTTMNTQFMNMLGVDTLVVPARATAEEKISKVEISLVLDISGSMQNNSKMANLRTAASDFVDTVLSPENHNLISVSLIPYSQHVNAGPLIYNRMNVNTRHNYSHCIEFNDNEFNSTVLNTNRTFNQMQHFQWNYYSIETGNQLNTRHDTMCPRYSYERIVPLSQDATHLKAQIAQLKPRAGTQIFLGMKWAAAMLDPSFSNITQSLVTSGNVDGAFSNRPASYSDVETLKTVVLMTDGQNSSAIRIANSYYNSSSEYVHWNNWNFQYYLWSSVNRRQHSNFYYTKYTESSSDGLLYNICDAAKARNILIWSIGFEVGNHGADVMEYCASSESHFFRVDGAEEINDAFNAIARQINQLRLTQ